MEALQHIITIKMAHEAGYTSSALDYSIPLPRYTELDEGRFVKHHPVNTISGASTINFTIPPTDDFIDLPECYIDVKLKITDAKGVDLTESKNVAFADNVPHSIFKSAVVYLNSESITPSTVYQTYANYIATRFGVSKAGAKTHLQKLQGLTAETPGKNDAKEDSAKGWTMRKKWTDKSKEVHFIAQVPSDFFRSCGQFLPPLQDLRIEFKLNNASFALIGDVAYDFKVTQFELFTRQVPVVASRTMEIFKQQAVQPLMLNFTSLSVQSFTIAQNKQVEFIRGIFPTEMPHQIFMILVETDRINGVPTKDPFKFENGMVEKVILRQNGMPIMTESQWSNFDTASGLDAKEVYYFVCQAFDVGHNSRDINLSYEQFVSGSTMWAWTLNPDMDGNNGMILPQKPANLEADIYVKPGHNNPGLTALFIGKCGKSVRIAKDNKVTLL